MPPVGEPPPPPAVDPGGLLTTEHFTLQTARSATISDSTGRSALDLKHGFERGGRTPSGVGPDDLRRLELVAGELAAGRIDHRFELPEVR